MTHPTGVVRGRGILDWCDSISSGVTSYFCVTEQYITHGTSIGCSMKCIFRLTI